MQAKKKAVKKSSSKAAEEPAAKKAKKTVKKASSPPVKAARKAAIPAMPKSEDAKAAAKKTVPANRAETGAAKKKAVKASSPAKPGKLEEKVQSRKSSPSSTKAAVKKAAVKEETAQAVPVEKPMAPEFPSSSAPVEPPPMPAMNPQQQYWQDRYQDDRLMLLIRDPYWCFAYWDVSAPLQTTMIHALQQDHAKLLLRTYDVTDINFDGSNAHRSLDIEINEEASNWYINVWEAHRAYCVDLGLLYPDGTFKTLLRSNVVTTPRDSISPVVDEEWMVVDEMFDQLYQNAGAGSIGRSSEAITKYMLKRVRADVTSGGLASMGSEGGRPQPPQSEDFWLVAHTELIVYGATEPTAKLTIQGQSVMLNNDGTFSVRFALPDGQQIIPIKAVNESDTQERSITPVVEKRTE